MLELHLLERNSVQRLRELRVKGRKEIFSVIKGRRRKGCVGEHQAMPVGLRSGTDGTYPLVVLSSAVRCT